MLCEGERETQLLALARVPLTHGGRVGFQVENALAAAAAAWSCGWALPTIRRGLETFGSDMQSCPGRFNLLEYNGATVIVDYGHNVSSLQRLIETIAQFALSRRITVYTAAGDRRNEDMIRQGELLAAAFDIVVLFEDQYVRGREPGEIMRLLRQGMTGPGARARDIQELKDSESAIEAALAMTQPGDLLLIQADTIDATVEFIQRRLVRPQHAREVALDEVADPAERTTHSFDAAANAAASYAPATAGKGAAGKATLAVNEELSTVMD